MFFFILFIENFANFVSSVFCWLHHGQLPHNNNKKWHVEYWNKYNFLFYQLTGYYIKYSVIRQLISLNCFKLIIPNISNVLYNYFHFLSFLRHIEWRWQSSWCWSGVCPFSKSIRWEQKLVHPKQLQEMWESHGLHKRKSHPWPWPDPVKHGFFY